MKTLTLLTIGFGLGCAITVAYCGFHIYNAYRLADSD